MRKKEVVRVLREHGFAEGRLIALSKIGDCKSHPEHFAVFNAQVFIRRGRILKQADLDLSGDAMQLTAAAHAAGENLYVLYENSPHPFWMPGSLPIARVLRNAVWWTRIRLRDQDPFLPLPQYRRVKSPELKCAVGEWRARAAYCVSVWDNPEFASSNTTGAMVQLWEERPSGLQEIEREESELERYPVNTTRGRPVRPVFYHRCGLLEYIWFSHGAALPAALYDCSLRHLGSVKFDTHRDTRAIQDRRGSDVIGLVWPCSIAAPEVTASARRQLRAGCPGRTIDARLWHGPDP